jgi:hypothetical protein
MSGFWGYRGPVPAFKRYFKIGPFALERVPSWNDPIYPRFGLWGRRWGFTLRYRAYLLHVYVR